jgi:hypothetical protein
MFKFSCIFPYFGCCFYEIFRKTTVNAWVVNKCYPPLHTRWVILSSIGDARSASGNGWPRCATSLGTWRMKQVRATFAAPDATQPYQWTNSKQEEIIRRNTMTVNAERCASSEGNKKRQTQRLDSLSCQHNSNASIVTSGDAALDVCSLGISTPFCRPDRLPQPPMRH